MREDGSNLIYLRILIENTKPKNRFELHKADEIDYTQTYTNDTRTKYP